MNFDIGKLYSAIDADQLEPGDQVICADNMSDLKKFVAEAGGKNKNLVIGVIETIADESETERFKLVNDIHYSLAYLVKKVEYRPFKSTKELVDYWYSTYLKQIVPDPMMMPLIWIQNKETRDKELIISYGEDRYYTENTAGDMKGLLDSYTFLDGSACGVKK